MNRFLSHAYQSGHTVHGVARFGIHKASLYKIEINPTYFQVICRSSELEYSLLDQEEIVFEDE